MRCTRREAARHRRESDSTTAAYRCAARTAAYPPIAVVPSARPSRQRWIILRPNRKLYHRASIGLLLLHELTFYTLRPAGTPACACVRSGQRGSQIAVTPPPFGQAYYLQSRVHPRGWTGDPHACRGAIFATPHRIVEPERRGLIKPDSGLSHFCNISGHIH